MSGLFGGGGGAKIPAPAKKSPVKVEPNLDRARAKLDVRSKQRQSLAVQRPMSDANVKRQTLG